MHCRGVLVMSTDSHTRINYWVVLPAIVVLVMGYGCNKITGRVFEQQPVPFIKGFERVEMLGASRAQIEAALLWRSVIPSTPHDSDAGRQYLSLNPIDSTLPPLIWEVGTPKPAAIHMPILPEVSGATAIRVLELGAFHGGLAPVQVEIIRLVTPVNPLPGTSAPSQFSWGYINAQGEWKILPRYKGATAFVGDVAVVEGHTSDATEMLINRRGEVIPWNPAADVSQYGRHGFSRTRLERAGAWTKITQTDGWVQTGQGVRGQQVHLSDGSTSLTLPGVEAMHSPDGELWLLSTNGGRQLWSPRRGFIKLPDRTLPSMPLAKNLFLGYSPTTSSALYALDGTLVLSPAPVVTALNSQRFIACESRRYSFKSMSQQNIARYLTQIPSEDRCGIMDDRGRWWAKPVHQVIERWGEYHVRLQSEESVCIADLRALSTTDCGANPTSNAPLPMLQIKDGLPRTYGYRKAGGAFVVPYGLSRAYPFAGMMAEVGRDDGLPGLINTEGKWLTPTLEGLPVEQAQIRAAVLAGIAERVVESKRGTARVEFKDGQAYATASRYTGLVRGTSGAGLIGRQGHWVIPPVFESIAHYKDGTVRACMLSPRSETSCEHLDTAGKVLPPSSEAVLSYSAPETPQSPVSQPGDLKATAINGRWGFQNKEGEWVIAQQFDDAEDFVAGRGVAGVLRDRAATDYMPGGRRMLWGLIDTTGRWVAGPKFESIGSFQGDVALAAEAGQQGLLQGLIDRQGQWLAQPKFKAISAFVNGVAVATRVDNTQCILTPKGHCDGPEDLESIVLGTDKYVVAQQKNNRGGALFGYLGAEGRGWAIGPAFIAASPFVGDYAVARGTQPSLPENLRTRRVTIDVQRFVQAGVAAVTVVHPDPADVQVAPMGLVDDAGRWLVPIRQPDNKLNKGRGDKK